MQPGMNHGRVLPGVRAAVHLLQKVCTSAKGLHFEPATGLETVGKALKKQWLVSYLRSACKLHWST
jgi:hypothetical protein